MARVESVAVLSNVDFASFLTDGAEQMTEPFNQLMKLIVVGDSGTGKSCLLHRFVEDTFCEEQTQTIGVEFGAKVIQLNGQKIKLQIWDTAGQERYRSVTRGYYRGAVGCLVVYDVTCRPSYDHVPQWLEDVKQLACDNVAVMLVGNKADLAIGERRAVSHNEAALFAQERGYLHFETSASTGEFVADAFLKVAKTALDVANKSAGAEAEEDIGIDMRPSNTRSGKCSC
jgi:Rab family protein